MLEVTAPIIEGQLMESFIIKAVNLQVNLASKAARCVYAAAGRNIVDFSLRRTQGTDAALKPARAGYIAGEPLLKSVIFGGHSPPYDKQYSQRQSSVSDNEDRFKQNINR